MVNYILSTLILKFTLHFLARNDFVRAANKIGTELFEIRIYEGAPVGTKATLNEAFDNEIKDLKNCFAQLDTEVDWIDFDPTKMIFETSELSEIPSEIKGIHPAILHSMCAGNKMRSIHFSIHVTRKNRHPPRFSADHFQFYVPASLGPGLEVGRIEVFDNDPIIYNSQIQLRIAKPLPNGASKKESGRFLDPEPYWKISKNGTINVQQSMANLQLYRSYTFRIIAMDFGSPQLFAFANVTIVPVSVSQPENVRLNIATRNYQIFEWDSPVYGQPEKFRLTIRHGPTTVYEQDLGPSDRIAMTKLNLPLESEYTATVTAVTVDGNTPSKALTFTTNSDDILGCNGECRPDAGIPMCYYSKNQIIEQFRDRSGQAFCLCFEGFSGAQCDSIEYCSGERIVERHGSLDWRQTPVNRTASLLCPYNAGGESLERQCKWDAQKGIARWENTSNEDTCKSQSSILVHLGVLANYAQRNDQSVSGLQAVLRFLDSVLQFPAFDSRLEYAHFDSKVGEHVVQLLDTLANRDLFGSTNGTEKHRLRLLNYIQQFTRRMPISYSISSPKGGLQLRSWSVVNDESRSVEQQHYWASFESSAEFYSFERDPSVVHFTGNCFLRVPSKFAPAVVRAFCLRNSTLLPDLDGYSPILNTELEEQGMANLANRPSEEPMVQQMARSEDEGLFHRSKLASTRKHSNFSPFSNQGKILIGLRPTEVSFLPSNFNYTCAIYDHNENRWTTEGITIVSRDPYNGLIICESNRLATFALLPEWKFKTSNILLTSIPLVLPIGTASLVIVSSVLSLMIGCFQRDLISDPALNLLLSAVILIHFIHIATFSHIFAISLPIDPLFLPYGISLTLDQLAYLAMQFSVLAIAASTALINASLHSRILQVRSGKRHIASQCAKTLVTFAFGAVFPLVMCILTAMFNGFIICEMLSENPIPQPLTSAFYSSFLLPLVVFTGCASGYGCYSHHYGRSLASDNSQPERRNLLVSLSRAGWLSLIVLFLAYSSTSVIFYPYGQIRNMILATIHILMAIFISILSVVLIRIQKTMPSCQRNTCRSSNPRESNGRPRDSQIKDKKLKNQNGFQKAADSDAFWNGNDYGGTINSDSRKSVVNGQSPDRQFLLQQSLSPKTTFVESVHKNGCGGETLSLRRNVVVFNDEADVYHGYSAGRRFSELSQQYPTKSYVDAGGFVGFPPGPVVWNEHNGKDHQKEVRLAFLDGTVDSRPPATVRSFQSSRTTAGPPIAQFAYNNNNNGKESAELAAGDFENLEEFLDIQSISTSLQETNDSNKTTQSNQSVPSPSPYPHPLVSVV